jgi:hypothetical protein
MIDGPFYSYTFYTRSGAYKKQGAPDWCPVLFVYILYLQFCMFPIDDHYTFHTQ